MWPDRHAYHDDGKRHGKPRDTGEEGCGSDEGHSSWVDPCPVGVRWDSAVKVGEEPADRSAVQGTDEPKPDRKTRDDDSLRSRMGKSGVGY